MFDPFGMYEGAFVMTDRGTGTIWAHLTGEGLAGPLLGRTLDQVPVVTTTARAWMDAHPDSSAPDRAVMAPPMDLSPKLGATTLETISRLDERLEAHTLVLGVMAGGRVRAYAMHEGLRLHQDTLGDVPVALIASDGGYPLAYDRRLAENGFRVRPLVHMQRPVDADAAPGTAAFTLARVEPGEMPEGRIQILTHRTEAMVWQPRWLSHPNGALALTSIMIVVADIEEAARRFARFTDRQTTPSPLGQTIELDRGRVQLVTADAFARKVPEVAIPSLPFMGAYAIRVASLGVIGDMLKRAGLRTRRSEQDLVAIFPEELGRGAWLFAE